MLRVRVARCVCVLRVACACCVCCALRVAFAARAACHFCISLLQVFFRLFFLIEAFDFFIILKVFFDRRGHFWLTQKKFRKF